MRNVFAVAFLVFCSSLVANESSSEPAARNKDYGWMSMATWKERHEGLVNRAKQGNIDLLFLGDSITEGWGANPVWKKNYAQLNAANFGIGGDTTKNVLWRITNGELDGISPKVAVILIGTNNFGLNGDNPDGVTKGVVAVVQAVRVKLPKTKVLLLAIFPRDPKPDSPIRAKIKTVNEQLAKLDDQKTIRYLDIGPKLQNADGSLSKEIMPDFLHLSLKGYQIWVDAMQPLLDEMMK